MPTDDRIDAETLASRAGVAPARIDELARLGIVARDSDGTFATGDVASARLAFAFEASGISLEDVGAATNSGQLPELARLILTEPVGLRGRSSPRQRGTSASASTSRGVCSRPSGCPMSSPTPPSATTTRSCSSWRPAR